jgi:hypothetical protein
MTALNWDFRRYDGDRLGYGFNTDAVYGGNPANGNASDLELTTTWAVNAAYTHFWNPAWKRTLWGSYRAVSFNDQANAMLCSVLGDGVGAGTSALANAGCDQNWQAWGLGLRTEWDVSKTFSMGLEVLYANLNSGSNSNGQVKVQSDAGNPTQVYSNSDQDLWAVRFRATRAFYP